MTIKDIAKACGVGVSTVSRVLNNKPDVSESVRQKVLAAVKQSGYIPNDSARNLVKGSSDAIGVVVRGLGNIFFADMLKTISAEINKSDYTMVLHFIDSTEDEIKAGAALEREKRLRALIFLGGRYDYTPQELSAIGIPYVFCSYSNHFGSLPDGSYSSIAIDDYKTAYKAVTHLITMGHRKIAALVPWKNDHSVSQLRFKGYLDALRDNNIVPEEKLIMETGSYTMDTAYEGMRMLLENGTEFSAVFSVSDTQAIAAMKAIESAGARVPEDYSVIAIDGISVSEYTCPTLTTMIQPVEEMGRECVNTILSILNGRVKSRHIRLETELRSGASVKSI